MRRPANERPVTILDIDAKGTRATAYVDEAWSPQGMQSSATLNLQWKTFPEIIDLKPFVDGVQLEKVDLRTAKVGSKVLCRMPCAGLVSDLYHAIIDA